jgi:hypothetical protein
MESATPTPTPTPTLSVSANVCAAEAEAEAAVEAEASGEPKAASQFSSFVNLCDTMLGSGMPGSPNNSAGAGAGAGAAEGGGAEGESDAGEEEAKPEKPKRKRTAAYKLSNKKYRQDRALNADKALSNQYRFVHCPLILFGLGDRPLPLEEEELMRQLRVGYRWSTPDTPAAGSEQSSGQGQGQGQGQGLSAAMESCPDSAAERVLAPTRAKALALYPKHTAVSYEALRFPRQDTTDMKDMKDMKDIGPALHTDYDADAMAGIPGDELPLSAIVSLAEGFTLRHEAEGRTFAMEIAPYSCVIFKGNIMHSVSASATATAGGGGGGGGGVVAAAAAAAATESDKFIYQMCMHLAVDTTHTLLRKRLQSTNT